MFDLVSMLPWQRAAQAPAGVDSDESTVMECYIEIYHTVDQTQTAMAQDLTGAARRNGDHTPAPLVASLRLCPWLQVYCSLESSEVLRT